jgi:hypothetical protein
VKNEPFHGLRRVTDGALEILEVQILLGQPPMSILLVALEANPYTLLLGEFFEGGRSMRVVTLEAEPVAHPGVLALFILAYDLFMALCTVDQAQPLGMRKRPDIVMAIYALQITVDGGTKPIVIHIECKFPLSHLLLAWGRNDHLELLFPAHLEDILSPVTFEARPVLYGKGHPGPCKEGKKCHQYERNSEESAREALAPILISKLVHPFTFSQLSFPKPVLFLINRLTLVKINFD